MKKQAVRVQEFKDEKLGFGFANLQILMPTSQGSNILEPIGDIQFQRTLSEGPDAKWYGLHYKVDCSHTNLKHLKAMNKIADLVIKKCKEDNVASYELQPVDVLDAVNAERYGVFQHEFVKLDQAGETLYDVMYKTSLHSRVVAPADVDAEKLLKEKGFKDMYLVINSVVQFPKH